VSPENEKKEGVSPENVPRECLNEWRVQHIINKERDIAVLIALFKIIFAILNC